MLNATLYILATTVTTLFVQKQKIFDLVFRTQFLKTMRSCQICLGYWVGLVFFFVFSDGLLSHYYSTSMIVKVIDPLFTSMLVTLAGYYITEGIRVVHLITVIK